MIRFTVYGKPEPAGSKRAFAIRKEGIPTGKVAVSDANPRAKSWQREVTLAAMDAVKPGEMLDGPLWLKVNFYVERPRGHYGTGRNSGTVKRSAPDYPTVAPDTTKLVRAVEDAMSGVIYRDDALIVGQTAWKRYGLPARAEITVSELEAA